MVSLGGGTLTASGLTMDLVVGCEYYSGAGVLNWVGAGSAVMVGVSQSRSIGVGAVYGIGGTMAVGAGDLIVVGNANADNLGCASVVLLGGNYFLVSNDYELNLLCLFDWSIACFAHSRLHATPLAPFPHPSTNTRARASSWRSAPPWSRTLASSSASSLYVTHRLPIPPIPPIHARALLTNTHI